jgi:hypothetical protein
VAQKGLNIFLRILYMRVRKEDAYEDIKKMEKVLFSVYSSKKVITNIPH